MQRRAFLWILGILIFFGSSLGLIAVRKKRFPGFPGIYMCKDFGIPGRANNFLYVSAEGIVQSDHYGSGDKMQVGKLITETRKQASFELSEGLFLDPNLVLDASALHHFVADKKGIRIVGSKDGNVVYEHICERK